MPVGVAGKADWQVCRADPGRSGERPCQAHQALMAGVVAMVGQQVCPEFLARQAFRAFQALSALLALLALLALAAKTFVERKVQHEH